MQPKCIRHLGLQCAAFGNRQDERDQCIVIHVHLNPMQLKEDEGSSGPCTLVSVDERVVADNVIEVRRCHLVHICVQKLASE